MKKRNVLVLFVLLFVAGLYILGTAIAQEDTDNSGEGVGEEFEDSGFDDFEDENEFDNSDDSDFDDFEDENEFDDVDEEDEIEGYIREAEEFDEELEVGSGITPDSAFYFVEDVFLSKFRDDSENREKKAAEMRAMAEKCGQGDEGACEALDVAFEKYKEHADEFEREVSPDKKDEAERSSRAIRGTIVREIAKNVPAGEKDELIREVVKREKNIEIAADVANKIKELCEQLSKLDPGEFYRVCRAEDDGPKWQKNLFEDLTEEQEKEARIFFDVLSKCMKTEGRECDCDRVPHVRFAAMCSAVAPLATACSEGDEDACDRMDDETEDMFEVLEDAPHLQRILEELDGVNEDRIDKFMPPECREAGATNPRECMKIMFEIHAPEECQEALERGEIDFKNEREARAQCEEIMFRENAPEECVEAGIRDHKECGRLMFEQNAPEECIEAGLTGDGRNDPRKCEEIMRSLERGDGDFGHGFRGPDCRGIENPEERLKCYDGATNNVREFRNDFDERFRETKEREGECARECKERGQAWDFSGGECRCFGGGEDFRRDDFRQDGFGGFGPPEGFSPPEGFIPPEGWSPEQGPPPGFSPPEGFEGGEFHEGFEGSFDNSGEGSFDSGSGSGESGSGSSESSGSGSGGEGGSGESSGGGGESPPPGTGEVVAGGFITGNAFLDYYFRWWN